MNLQKKLGAVRSNSRLVLAVVVLIGVVLAGYGVAVATGADAYLTPAPDATLEIGDDRNRYESTGEAFVISLGAGDSLELEAVAIVVAESETGEVVARYEGGEWSGHGSGLELAKNGVPVTGDETVRPADDLFIQGQDGATSTLSSGTRYTVTVYESATGREIGSGSMVLE